ncbi:MAG TPA: hypothetical protein VF469_05950 [Kofleriaceae bacterium]
MSRIRLAALSSLLLPVSLAHAETTDETGEEPIAARAPANEDSFTPGLTHSAAVGRAIATATATLDGAKHLNTVDLNGEVQVFGPVRLVLRVDNMLAGGNGKARPGIGAAVQLLDERKHGVAGSAYVSYKAEGFTEAEGEIESLVSFGKQFGPVHSTLNLAYGQDPEGVERDGELALGLHVEPIHGLFTGVVGRFRDALGSNGDKGVLLNGGQILRDALGGASATYVIGNIGLTATAGIAGVTTTTSHTMQAGPAAAFTVGTVF